MAVSVGQEIAAADLGGLVFTPVLNFHGETSFTYAADDGTAFAHTPATVTLRILSAAEQADQIAERVAALVAHGVLTQGQGKALGLPLAGNPRDAGKVKAFLNKVKAFAQGGVLTEAEANGLVALGDLLLITVSVQ